MGNPENSNLYTIIYYMYLASSLIIGFQPNQFSKTSLYFFHHNTLAIPGLFLVLELAGWVQYLILACSIFFVNELKHNEHESTPAGVNDMLS